MEVRRSSRQQDAAETTAEGAVQVRPRRSTVSPKDLRVEQASAAEVGPLILREHYIHSMPAAATHCFAVRLHGALVGAAIITLGSAQAHTLLRGARPGDVLTLARLWLADHLPAHSESRVLAVTVRLLRGETNAKALVTFADPRAGHSGTIYRAAGFLYLGTSRPDTYFEVDGRLCHPRTAAWRYGATSFHHLRATGVPAIPVLMPGKHRYAVMLDPTWAWRLRYEPRPYLGTPSTAPGIAG
jgi:hypothetical protein